VRDVKLALTALLLLALTGCLGPRVDWDNEPVPAEPEMAPLPGE